MQTEKSLYYNELAIASLTIGVSSFMPFLFGLERGIIAIVFGILALRRIKQDQMQRGKVLAIVGVVLGVIYTLLVLIMLPHAIELSKNVIKSIK